MKPSLATCLRPAALIAALIATLTASLPAGAAGGLYGTVRQQARPVTGQEIELACPGFGRPGPASATRTDGQGGYTLRVPPMTKGRCELRLNRRGAPLAVFVSESSLRYDLELDAQGNLRER